MAEPIIAEIRAAVDASLPRARTSVLAVSGGIDSMVLLDAALAVRPGTLLRVATFDHLSGSHSAAARELVETTAMRASLSVVVGEFRAGAHRPSEATWRDARLGFLHAVAAESNGTLSTAHTRDDQVETVLFRELRGAGPRGLAALRAPGGALRPLVAFTRSHVSHYASAAGVEWREDPTNADRTYARNRIRHELLPRLRAVSPAIDDELWAVGERAAAWRAAVERRVDVEIAHRAERERGVLDVPYPAVRDRSVDELAIIWPVLLGRIGVASDWRGTRRLVEFTSKGSPGQRIQLSGGWLVRRVKQGFEVRREPEKPDPGTLRELPFLSD